jgi:hypothetical protein
MEFLLKFTMLTMDIIVKYDIMSILTINSCIVNTNDLRKLPQEFAQKLALAFKSCLDGVDVFAGSAADSFVSFITNLDSFTVKYLNAIDGVLNIHIYSADGSDLNEFLMESSIPKVAFKIFLNSYRRRPSPKNQPESIT